MSDVEVKESGKLEEKPALPRILEMIETKFAGVMVFVRGKDRRSLAMDNQTPLILTKQLKEDVLGRSLFEKNIITADQFKKIKEIETSGKSFFDSVSEVISKRTTTEFVLESWFNDLAIVAHWDIGQFASIEFLPKEMTKVETEVPIVHYLFKAAIQKNKKRKPRFSSYARFEQDQLTDKFYRIEDLRLEGNEQKVFENLSQSKTIKNLIAETKLADQDVTSILFALRDLGVVRADSDAKKKVTVQPKPVTPAKTPEKTQRATNDEKQDFLAKLARIDELDFFQLLGITKAASSKDVQDMYFMLAKKYHPDRLKASPEINLKDAEQFFTRITEAYNVLSNAQSRREYENSISASTIEHEKLLQRIVDSEQIYLEGQAFLQRNLYKEAVEKIQKAIQLYDQEPEYFIKLGWALFRQGV